MCLHFRECTAQPRSLLSTVSMVTCRSGCRQAVERTGSSSCSQRRKYELIDDNSSRDGDEPEILAGKFVGVWLSEQIGRPVFRAFNNIQAHVLAAGGRAAGDPDRIALPVSGPNGADLARVQTLV